MGTLTTFLICAAIVAFLFVIKSNAWFGGTSNLSEKTKKIIKVSVGCLTGAGLLYLLKRSLPGALTSQETQDLFLGWFLIMIVLGVIAYHIRLLFKEGISQREILVATPVLLMFYGLVAINALILFLIRPVWIYFWGNAVLFWSLNIGMLFFIFLFKLTKPPNNQPVEFAKKIAIAFLFVLIVGAIYQIAIDKREISNPFAGMSWFKSEPARPVVIPKGSFTPRRMYPPEIVLPILAKCESGDRQFDKNGKPLRNPERGSSAVGRYQILQITHGPKALSMGWDLETDEGQQKYAEYLVRTEGLTPWEADPRSRSCWEPLLAERIHKGFEIVINAPADKWTEPVPIPIGFTVISHSDQSFQVKNDRGIKVECNKVENFCDSIEGPSESLSHTSMDLNGAKIRLEFKPVI